MFDWIDFNHSMKKAHTSIAVAAIILIGGTALVGPDAPDGQLQAVAAVAFFSGCFCLSWLYRREDRARERAEQAESRSVSQDSPTG